VGRGDLTRFAKIQTKDELGVLANAFNTMIRQLQFADEARARDQARIEGAKNYLEGILSNLSTGVVVLTEAGRIEAVNPAAEVLLAVAAHDLIGRSVTEIQDSDGLESLRIFCGLIRRRFDDPKVEAWEDQLEFSGREGREVLHVRGSRLRGSNDAMVVFDDITDLLQAQREAAWGEVARRLAHEIKNPLTPIQLAAENLQRKLTDRVGPDERELVNRSTATIVNQVDAMKSMVDDFSTYARTSGLVRRAVDLNGLISEMMTLYEPLGVRLVLRLEPLLPAVSGDSKLLRQVLHNLIQNSVDVLHGITDPEIEIVTALTEEGIVLVVSDNGPGIPETLISRIFEPYVTGKAKGTGLGLAIVKKIVDEHGGKIQCMNRDVGGAQFVIQLPPVRDRRGEETV
jgi:PAS domain S-box-containing protein